MFRRAVLAVGVLGFAVAGLAQPAGAGSPRTSTTVHDFHTFDLIEGASASLTRTTTGLSATFKTTLPAGHAETMWWVIFNNPDGCTDGCGDDEIGTVFGGGPNPAGVSILNADGRVAAPSGPTTFAA